MNTFLRSGVGLVPVAVAAACLSLPLVSHAQEGWVGADGYSGLGEQHVTIPGDDPAMLNQTQQGYLGVGMRDVDTDRAAQLKLKAATGVEVVTVDHDAPACRAASAVTAPAQQWFARSCSGSHRESAHPPCTPAGHTVSLLISRDGQQQTLAVQLADRATLEADAWSQHIPVPDPDTDATQPAGTGGSFGSGIFSSLISNPFYTGLDLDMLGPQLANYFGVHDGQGLLVRRVDENSPAAVAGLRAGDVITKVNGQNIATTNQWAHTIHSNRGKPLELTVIRDKHEGTVNMVAGRAKNKS
jgi:serine protease Do